MILAVVVGVCLSATCGFRVFTPMLMTSVFHHMDWLILSGGFEWIGSTPALIAFAVAAMFEVSSNYLPFIASILKAIAIPAAIIAGTLLMAAYIGEMNEFLTWSIALIAGGGTAGTISTTMVPIKASSELIPIVGPVAVSFGEDLIAFFTPILVFVIPIAAVVFVTILIIILIVLIRKFRFRRRVIT